MYVLDLQLVVVVLLLVIAGLLLLCCELYGGRGYYKGRCDERPQNVESHDTDGEVTWIREQFGVLLESATSVLQDSRSFRNTVFEAFARLQSRSPDSPDLDTIREFLNGLPWSDLNTRAKMLVDATTEMARDSVVATASPIGDARTEAMLADVEIDYRSSRPTAEAGQVASYLGDVVRRQMAAISDALRDNQQASFEELRSLIQQAVLDTARDALNELTK